MMARRLTKRQKRMLRQEGVFDGHHMTTGKFYILDIERKFKLTDTQLDVMDAYDQGNHLVLHGMAGTGKTFLSMYLALNEIEFMASQKDLLTGPQKVYIVRSVVPTRDMGFLPGNWKQKAAVYEDPYRQIASELYGRGDAYDILSHKNMVEFITTSFVRGTTFRDCVIIVDEMNNMNFHELDSLITRVGDNCRIIFCGDYRQSDLSDSKDKDGLLSFLKILNNIRSFTSFEFGIDDIVRSGIVKEYIIEKSKLYNV